LNVVGSFLAGKGLDGGVGSEVLLNDFVAVDVLVQLGVAEQVLGLQLHDGRVPQVVADFLRRVQDALDHAAGFPTDFCLQVLPHTTIKDRVIEFIGSINQALYYY
jgi:hypothetical protein